MNSEIIYTDQNIYLHQAVNMFISAVKFHILTWGSIGIDSLLQPAPSGHSRNCSLWLFLIVLTAQHGSLPLAINMNHIPRNYAVEVNPPGLRY